MSEKGIRIKDGGIILDEDNERISINAGKASIVVDGKNQQIALCGKLTKMNKGDETEEVFLKKTSTISALIPSTTFTPIPQALPNIPIGEAANMIKDIVSLIALYTNLK